MAVLNPSLFSALKLRFGEVKISSPGDKGKKQYYTSSDGKKRVRYIGGEHYRINCPLCGDRRFRLWIHYLFGTYDNVINQKVFFCAYCFNCNAKPGDGRLLKILNLRLNSFQASSVRVSQEKINSAILKPEPAKLPGEFFPLVDFSERHPVIEYLRERRFNPQELWETFGIGVCLSKNPLINKRIFIPVFWFIDNKYQLVGWQARAVPGYSDRQEPKYYTMSGFKKSIVLFNFWKAIQNDFLVITEGPFDAMRLRQYGVALFGKSISATQVTLLRKYARNKHWIIMLDKSAELEARQIKQQLTQSSSFLTLNNKILIIPPVADDPGDSSYEDLMSKIKNYLNN